MENKIVILGGGQVSAYASKTIREHNKKVQIQIITEENHNPYERPPLSKDCLLNKTNYDECSFFNKDFYIKNEIEILKNKKIVKTDFKKNILIDENNNSFQYNKLLIATGSINRILKIDGHIVTNDKIIYLRNIEDSKKIKNKIQASSKILVIGGGFIGLEIASAISQLDKFVTIIEKSDQLMGRVIPKDVSNIVSNKHLESGNKIFFNSEILSIEEQKNEFKIMLSSKEIINADLIIVGIGSVPNIDIFKNSNLKINNGIITNQNNKTSIKDVYAAGDVANFYHPFYKKNLRLETYKHAQNHGLTAGKNIIGINTDYTDIPWMWSDQFDLNLQLVGMCDDFDNIIKRGNTVDNGIVYFFLKNRIIVGACGIGKKGKIGKNITIAGRLSEKIIEVNTNMLSDESIKLNKLL